ncbi:hypothetical protein [Nocardia blacklockiae]|uniref:hypothetical protein n=1 Tax=Nocardia blacklockiae TaxID=480036 RepID=UPI002B4B76E0|nr:hypothetical protein [Nocardia blacklockiae]
MQFTLAHHLERGARDSINGGVEFDLAAGGIAQQENSAELDVALLAQRRPHCR